LRDVGDWDVRKRYAGWAPLVMLARWILRSRNSSRSRTTRRRLPC